MLVTLSDDILFFIPRWKVMSLVCFYFLCWSWVCYKQPVTYIQLPRIFLFWLYWPGAKMGNINSRLGVAKRLWSLYPTEKPLWKYCIVLLCILQKKYFRNSTRVLKIDNGSIYFIQLPLISGNPIFIDPAIETSERRRNYNSLNMLCVYTLYLTWYFWHECSREETLSRA